MSTKKTAPKHETREAWLVDSASRTGEIVARAAEKKVPRLYVSVGFPKGARGGRGGRAIGQCWDGASCRDGSPHVFVCPTLSDPVEVLAVLLHEQVHATVGCQEKHRGKFAAAMKAAGMVKPWTCSSPGEALAKPWPSSWPRSRRRSGTSRTRHSPRERGRSRARGSACTCAGAA